MAAVSLKGVKKSYAGLPVVHGIDCTIADGEFIVILGPSGCGKSTLLRMIAGLETITDGEIAIDGKVVNRVEPKDRNIAMVFQNYALYPHMSVYDNMAYGLRMRGLRKADIDDRVRRVASVLDLAALLDRKPRQLSGGQRQRVAMGRAIVREPLVFLFDEPLSNLDAKLRVQMRIEIKRLHAEIRTTSIYVTHDQVEAMTLADRLIVMNAGRVEQIGTPMEIYNRPATTFVAGFIGSPAMNMMAAQKSDDGRTVGLPGGAWLDLGSETGARALTAGLRPEHLLPARSDQALFELRVELVEELGADTLVHGRVGEDGPPLTVRLTDGTEVAPGRVLPLVIATANIHLFETGTGRRV